MSSTIGVADSTNNLQLAWWNTALSPNKNKGRATSADLSVATRVVDELIEAGTVILGFCEVSGSDLDHLLLHSSLSGFQTTRPGSVAGPASTFDTCIAFDATRLSLIDATDVLASYGGGQLRVGQRFAFALSDGGDALHVIISHWPSRTTLSANDPKRVLYGHVLRETVSELLRVNVSAKIVVMGDFNDEPFNDSIHISLRASRDRDRSISRSDVLYNPFWRHMASFEHDGIAPCSDKGTYFYASGDVARWHTFDQMIFSSSLLSGAEGWRLDEERTRAYSAEWLDTLLLSRASIFDHRPIVSLLRKG